MASTNPPTVFEAPCPYVPLTEYDWHATPDPLNPPTCPLLLWNPVVYSLFAAFEACTFCIAVYIHVQLFYTFKGKKSLYFWTILISTWGALVTLIGIILQQTGQYSHPAISTLLNIGWVMMVTGFALVLYSRLHLLNPSKRLLRVVLIIIIVNAFIFHTPVIVVTEIASVHVTPLLYDVYKVVAYFEIALAIQEVALASLYIYLFIQFTKDSLHEPGTRKALFLLLTAEGIVISSDIILCTLLYTKLYLARQMIQIWVSVVTLQIEFLILNWLRKFSHQHAGRVNGETWGSLRGDMEVADFITRPDAVREVSASSIEPVLDVKK